MSASPLIFMPFLHKELCHAALPSSLLQLWPGLPSPQKGFYIPVNFPLAPQDAAHYVEYVRNINSAAAENTPVHSLLATEKQARHLGVFKEMGDLSCFAQGKERETTTAYHMKEAMLAAQKILLQIWLLEERYMEIQELEQRRQVLSDDFSAMLGITVEDEEADILLLTQRAQHLDAITVPSVHWHFLLENAALFLPEHSILLFTDRSICSELRETTPTFANMRTELFSFSGMTPPIHAPKSTQAPLWQALGMEGARPGRPWLAKLFSFILWDDAQ